MLARGMWSVAADRQYVRLHNASTTPIATGEDIYLLENLAPC